MLENQACCRTVSEGAAILVGQATLGSADTTAARNDPSLSFHQTSLRGDRSNKGNLELKRCLRKALVEHGQDGEPHTAIEQRRSKATVNGPKRVAVLPVRFGGNNDTALGNVNDVVTEGLGHRVQRQGTIDESLDKFETVHCSLLVLVDDPNAFYIASLRHEFPAH